MSCLTNNDLFELAILYALCNRNNAQTTSKFNRLHQNSPEISRIFVYRMMKRLRTTGSFHPRPGLGRNRIYTEDQEIGIVAFFLKNPQTSIRAANEALGQSRMTIFRALNRHITGIHFASMDFNRCTLRALAVE